MPSLLFEQVFDPERLQALLELEAHHNWGWLRWMDWAAAAAGFIKPGQRLTLWKVGGSALLRLAWGGCVCTAFRART